MIAAADASLQAPAMVDICADIGKGSGFGTLGRTLDFSGGWDRDPVLAGLAVSVGRVLAG